MYLTDASVCRPAAMANPWSRIFGISLCSWKYTYNIQTYDKVYGYYSMWNVRNNMNQRNIESTQKFTEYT